MPARSISAVAEARAVAHEVGAHGARFHRLQHLGEPAPARAAHRQAPQQRVARPAHGHSPARAAARAARGSTLLARLAARAQLGGRAERHDAPVGDRHGVVLERTVLAGAMGSSQRASISRSTGSRVMRAGAGKSAARSISVHGAGGAGAAGPTPPRPGPQGQGSGVLRGRITRFISAPVGGVRVRGING